MYNKDEEKDMKNEPKTIINVAETLAAIIGSRDITNTYLTEAINDSKTSTVDLDFQNVEFISRSATHELLSLKEDLSRKYFNKKTISFINANKDVSEMFRIVAANRALPKSEAPSFKVNKTDIQSLLQREVGV
ncbi:MAG: hypothetical protein Q7S73_01200 [bacterium]|nr:hypothetical protein [bacterium]